jgi:hypothetical protein
VQDQRQLGDADDVLGMGGRVGVGLFDLIPRDAAHGCGVDHRHGGQFGLGRRTAAAEADDSREYDAEQTLAMHARQRSE